MRYAKRILVAAVIFSSYSAGLAFDKKEIDSAGGSSSKKSTDSGAPAAKPNAAKTRERLQQLSSGSTLSSNKDIRILQPDGSQNTSTVSVPGQTTITITTSSGNTTFHDATHGSTPLKTKIFWRRPNC
jgi:hypothetical protein